MNKKKYFPGPAAFFPAGPDFYIAYNFYTQKTFSIETKKAFKFSDLKGYKTEQEHINSLLEKYDQDFTVNHAQNFINELKQKHILRSVHNYAEERTFNKASADLNREDFNKTTESHNRSDIAVSVITCKRPELFRNTVKSIFENSNILNKRNPFYIFDDSETDEEEKKNKMILESLSGNNCSRVIYIGEKEKHVYIESLKRECSSEIIQENLYNYIFFGQSEAVEIKGSGGNKNSALLMQAGTKAVVFDDDIQYRIYKRDSFKSDLTFTEDILPDTDFFSSMKKLTSICSETDIDLINYINNILGKKTRSLIDNTSLADTIISPLLWEKLENNKSRVNAVFGGIAGGRWFSRPFPVYHYDGICRKKSYRNKKNYEKIKQSPVSLLLPDSLLISKVPFCVSTVLGFDGNKILPPFPPIGRNPDGVWVKLLQILDKYSFIGNLPYAVYHETGNRFLFTQEDYENTTPGIGVLTSLIFEYIFNKKIANLRKPNYQTFSKFLTEVSCFDDNYFITMCHELWLNYTGQIIGELEQLLKKNRKKPVYWAEDAANYIALLKKKLNNPLNAVPQELSKIYGIEKSLEIYKYFLNDYGMLIGKWPVIWNSAVKINRKRMRDFE